MYKIKPQGTQILLEKFEPEEKKKSKIYVPEHIQEEIDSEKMPFLKGKILAVGQLVKNTKVGDIILYESHVPIPFTFQGKDYAILKEEYITAYLVPEEQAEA